MKDLVFALYNDRLEVTKDGRSTEVKLSASAFDVCRMSRAVKVER